MKVFIAGGAGFIGSFLKKKYSDVLVYDIQTDASHDVRNPIKNEYTPDVIYNLAAIHKTPGHEDVEYFRTNILGAENVCQFARDKNVSTIVFTSSIAPYGSSEETKYEHSLPTPNTPYGISKTIAEEIHKRWQAEDPSYRKLIILRPGIVFGKNEGGNFTRLFDSLSRKVFMYPGRNDTKKACIYVKDLVNSMHKMQNELPPGVHLFNMCYPNPNSIKEIVDTICEVTGVRSPSIVIPSILIKTAASVLKIISDITGINLIGIHPDRVKKLMISTNISGEKLSETNYKLEFSLEGAILDWYKMNENTGLK